MANTVASQPTTFTPSLAGSYSGFMGPEFQEIQKIEDPFTRSIFTMELIRKRNEQDQLKNLPGVIKSLRDQQYEERLKARPLEFEELAAKFAMQSLADIPGKILVARHMYGPQEATNFSRGLQAFSAAPVVPRYF